MKKSFNTMMGLAMAIALSLNVASCNSDSDNGGSKDNKAKKETTAKPASNRTDLPNYRYVDSDTLLAHYNLAKDYSEEMLRLQNNYDNTARQRQAAIEGLAGKYQQKMQSNAMNEAEYNNAMKDMQQRQSAAQNELGQMQVSMQNQMMEAQKIVNDSIMSYIKEYNESHHYDAIFMKAATLYIDPALDITDEIIEGLNARYNKKK